MLLITRCRKNPKTTFIALEELEELEEKVFVSLVCVDEKVYLKDIEKLVGMRIPSEEKEGFEPDPNIKPEPSKQERR